MKVPQRGAGNRTGDADGDGRDEDAGLDRPARRHPPRSPRAPVTQGGAHDWSGPGSLALRMIVNASPAAAAATMWISEKLVSAWGWTSPNQVVATEFPTATPNTMPINWTSALAMLATPDCRCSVASSSMPIVRVMPGSRVTMAASVTTSGDALRPTSAISAALKLAAIAASGATIGSARRLRPAESATAPAQNPATAPAAASLCTAAEHRREGGAGQCVGGERDGPGTSRSGCAVISASATFAAPGSSASSSTRRTRSSSRVIASRSTAAGCSRVANVRCWRSNT